jgi:hypothetical protein
MRQLSSQVLEVQLIKAGSKQGTPLPPAYITNPGAGVPRPGPRRPIWYPPPTPEVKGERHMYICSPSLISGQMPVHHARLLDRPYG